MLMIREQTTGNLAEIRDILCSPSPAPVGLSDPVTEWVMVIARPGMEQDARDALRRRGVGAYWPNYPRLTVVKNRQTENGRPIRRLTLASVVSGIIFSPAKISSLFWNAIDLAPGVVNVARNAGGSLVTLNDTDIVLIHSIERTLNRPSPERAVHNFKMGQKVRLSGASSDRWHPGKIIKLARNGRISVEIDAMGRKVVFSDLLPHQIERM